MKVIFLDNDGVICLANNWGSRHKKQNKWGGRRLSMALSQIPIEYRFDNFDTKAIEVLNRILDKTGAEIIVSSDWRYHGTLEELGEYYTAQGIKKKPIGITPRTQDIPADYWNDKARFSMRYSIEEERAFEIKYSLGQFTSITNWVAVDDLNMSNKQKRSGVQIENDWGLSNFVHTARSREGIKQTGIEEKIISFLK